MLATIGNGSCSSSRRITRPNSRRELYFRRTAAFRSSRSTTRSTRLSRRRLSARSLASAPAIQHFHTRHIRKLGSDRPEAPVEPSKSWPLSSRAFDDLLANRPGRAPPATRRPRLMRTRCHRQHCHRQLIAHCLYRFRLLSAVTRI